MNPNLLIILIAAGCSLVVGGSLGALLMALIVSGSDRRRGTLDVTPAAARGELQHLVADELDDVDGGWNWPAPPRVNA